ncbi:hypothetical protein, partial [Acinetobacter sp. YH16037]|uniref:hypothetical protein n=1 Tax=Acinetobacter sp. YH16037 TaxID=2601182 RepID=UPI0027D25F9D
FLLPIYSSTSNFQLKADHSFISKNALFELYESFVFYSYNGRQDLAYCTEVHLSDDPYVTLYSVQYEEKFRHLRIRDFDFIYGQSFDELRKKFIV